MSENELVKLDDIGGLGLDKYTDEDFDAAQSSAQYLPRLQLMTSNAGVCKAGEFPTNHYALVADQNHTDLGKSVDLLVVTWRPKALETGNQVISAYQPSSEEFQRIQSKSFEANSGCMFGPEFLVWVPQLKRFSTFFMGTKSSRREAPNVKARLKKFATLSSKKIETPKFTWFAPSCTACTTPLEMPERDALLEAVEQFNNPPAPTLEGVSGDEESRAR